MNRSSNVESFAQTLNHAWLYSYVNFVKCFIFTKNRIGNTNVCIHVSNNVPLPTLCGQIGSINFFFVYSTSITCRTGTYFTKKRVFTRKNYFFIEWTATKKKLTSELWSVNNNFIIRFLCVMPFIRGKKWTIHWII